MANTMALPKPPQAKPAARNHLPSLPKVMISPFGVGISPCKRAELLDYLANAHEQRRKTMIDYINIDTLWQAQSDPEYRYVLNNLADVTLVDGMPVRWLAEMAGVRVPERLALSDVVPQVFQLAAQRDMTVFVLGSNSNTLSLAKKQLRAKNMLPHTVACWTEPRHKLNDPNINRDVLQFIHHVQPDILFVAMGAPWQSMWIRNNWEALPDCIILPVGGAFDFIAQTVKRAPDWMQQSGLEWVYRLTHDRQKRERSLFERYILNDIPFTIRLAFAINSQRRQNSPTLLESMN